MAAPVIRNMTARDMPEMIGLGAEMHQESRYKNLDFNPARLIALGDAILANPEMYCAKVAEVDGLIVGMIIGYAVPHFFGEDFTSGDLAVYVDKVYRKGMIGVRLIKAYDEWCTNRGVREPVLGVSAGINPERVGALYERLGYTEKYVIYKKPSR